MKALTIPELALVVLIGPSGCGKSTFARTHFAPTEVVSSDACRGMLADNENDQTVTTDAFDLLHTIARKRLALGRLTVVDATNVQPESRKPLLQIARDYHTLAVAIVFDVPASVCHARNAVRPDRNFGSHVVGQQRAQMRRGLRGLQREGFRYVHTLRSVEDIAAVRIERQRLWVDRRDDHGPFDIIGDVHGCFSELSLLLHELGYTVAAEELADGDHRYAVTHPAGRRVIFLGDLVDRGPASPDVLRLAMDMAASGAALCVPGNHDDRLKRKLWGKNVRITHGLAETLAQLEHEPAGFTTRVEQFLDGLVGHYVLAGGDLVVAHAGMKQELQGRASGTVRQFALYGETTGETDEYGLPVRHNWAAEYRGTATVVYGHTPVPEPEWLNRTINIDTGCVFGGRLTALRWPERELVSVPATAVWSEPVRPLTTPTTTTTLPTAQQEHDTLLDLEDVTGKRIIHTGLREAVTIRAENAAAALEVMSRFGADPRWLVYLPPTMSPCESSPRDGLLEHPDEAFEHFRYRGVAHVVCQEKHMGSRAVLVVCRDAAAAATRFGVRGEAGEVGGCCVSRTGRPFFTGDAALEAALLQVVRDAISAGDLWRELATDWVVLDAELMPWSAKAQGLLREQYAPVGAAGAQMLAGAHDALAAAASRGLDVAALQSHVATRASCVADYNAAWQRYCWPVSGLQGLRLAPFHLLASERGAHTGRDHHWHMDVLQRLAQADTTGVLMATQWRDVDTTDSASRDAAVAWWSELTAGGGEGMVVKPRDFIVHSSRGLVQPAIKVRGREYLRIIYGAEYTRDDQLPRLRSRALNRKRSLALREFALGVESLHRFVRREPLRRVHECVSGVLALESEPVDPRL